MQVIPKICSNDSLGGLLYIKRWLCTVGTKAPGQSRCLIHSILFRSVKVKLRNSCVHLKIRSK